MPHSRGFCPYGVRKPSRTGLTLRQANLPPVHAAGGDLLGGGGFGGELGGEEFVELQAEGGQLRQFLLGEAVAMAQFTQTSADSGHRIHIPAIIGEKT